MYKKALLINQEGKEFTGWTTEDFHPSTGELIFNTAMTGFVEILSDPSYVNQIITFTSSHIGNYGLSKTDFESERPRVNGAIGTSFTTSPSSWRAEQSITSWLKEYEIPYSGGFDVRSITSYLRDEGSSMFAFGTGLNSSELKELLEKSINIIGDNSALTAGRSKYDTNSTRNKIGILDLGAKQSIIDVIKNFGFECIFVDPKTTAQDIISLELSGLIISNGPGDPRSLINVVDTVRELIGKLPLFGICLGHQILSLACGLNVKKLYFGHHGSNHPVMVSGIKNALITSQNHGFTVEFPENEFEHSNFGKITEYAVNLNDRSNEGISIWESNAYSVQFHPESGPGTTDGLKLFDPFFQMLGSKVGN